MNEPVTVTADEKTFTLSTGGQTRTYPLDRDGKRQAVLDGLNGLETVTAGDDVYLPAGAVLQLVAAVLYPGGVETEAQYDLVCQTAEKACALAGWDEEVELAPPAVPFAARGTYRRRAPAPDRERVLEALENAGVSSYAPQQQVNGRLVWNRMAWDLFDRPLSGLSEQQRLRLRRQADAIAEEAGWQIAGEAGDEQYVRPLPADLEKARAAIDQCLAGYDSRPVRADTAQAAAQRGAYGRAFYSDELVPELDALLRRALAEYGYLTEPENGAFRPRPLALPGDAEERLGVALDEVEAMETEYGRALLLDEVMDAARQALGLGALSAWQAEQLLETGVLGRALEERGYRRESTWCQPYHFKPRLEGEARQEARQIILKEVRVTRDPERKLSLAEGLSVYTPAVVLDPDEEEVVYLEMVGAKQAVRANWAALVGGKAHWFGRQRVALEGMKNHHLVQAALPCGWTDYLLIHKQASLQAMNPEEPFYLLDDGKQQIPPLFYAMLNKCLAIPVLEAWSDFLWARGREAKLVALLNGGAGQGYAGWRVLPAPDTWQEVVQAGLAGEALSF